MDRDDLAEDRRGRLLNHMDRFNRALRLYRFHANLLRPTLARARDDGADPVRLLDVASGRGGFPRYLARQQERLGLRLQVTGSDYQPGHVAWAREVALREGNPARFRQVNGFQMGSLQTGSYDVVSCEQSLHHFTPGQLARLMREGYRVATRGFVGIDGVRSPLLAPAIVLAAGVLSRNPDFVHDALVTVRRFFHAEELKLIARAACPAASVSSDTALPGFHVIRIERPSSD